MGTNGAPGVETLKVTLNDDDGASNDASADVIATGTAETTEGNGWWKHQFGGVGSPHLQGDLLDAYLDAVNAVSSVFSEDTSLRTHEEAHGVLSPTAGNGGTALAPRCWRTAALRQRAVEWDSTVPLKGNQSIDYVTPVFDAEERRSSIPVQPTARGSTSKRPSTKSATPDREAPVPPGRPGSVFGYYPEAGAGLIGLGSHAA